MSSMSCALIFAFILGKANAAEYEWKGVFYTPEDSYTWIAEKVSGAYVDPTMILVAVPVSAATEDALAGASGKGKAAMAGTCTEVKSGGTIKPAEDKCYLLVFDQASAVSKYTVDAAGVTAIAFFGQHLPTEFEETQHYFKDSTGVDIEPVAQDPVPGDGHDHSHGHGEDGKGLCVCQAKEKGWKLDCTAKSKISDAVAALEAKAACKAADAPEDCNVNYHIMQAHHDHCLHNDLPTGIEKTLHDYEHFYDDCFIKRQFNPALSICPKVDCSDAKAMTEAVATLQAGCGTADLCASSACSTAMKVVLTAHDVCPEKDLPNNLEDALHNHEEPCEDQLCNTAEAAFDPYAESCGEDGGETPVASSAFGSQAFLVTMLALPLAVCSFHRT